MNSILAPPPRDHVVSGAVPTLSVIVAVYERAEIVADAVASALDQTVPPHEVIVCDDGSTEDVEGALEPYMDRITFLRETHRGESATKNTGVRAATGDFISILDCDDRYLPERNQAVGELAAARPDLDMITTNCFIEVEGDVVARGEDNWHFVVDDQRSALLRENFIFPALAVRRDRLLDVGGFDEGNFGATDWDCWLRLVFSGSLVAQIDRPLARYQVRPDSLSAQRTVVARAAVATLEKAGEMEMTRDERAVLEDTLAARRRTLRIEEAQDTLRDRAPDARRRSFAIATGKGYGLRTRAKAAFSAALPGAGRRMIQSRDRRRWIGAADIRVTRQR
jgi:hypothetical protein